jgi:hypothetical protein
MNPLIRFGSAAAVTAAALATVAGLAGPAGASTGHPGFYGGGASHAVFVQTDNTAGNQVVAYHRTPSGTLSLAGTYNTGGKGGQLTGSVVDHLASQGSLTYANGLLYAVNAGSNTVSVFGTRGDKLFLRQVIGSGGTFPVSVAVHGNLVYVLNALNGGSVQGYWSIFGRLVAIPRSNRPLHLNPSATPQFTNTPGQVSFTPDGSHLIVTTKANGNDIDVFGVGFGGELSASPVVNSEPSAVPFAITYTPAGQVVIAEAGTNALTTFALNASGHLTQLDQVGTGQMATCWVAGYGRHLFAANAGSGEITGYADGSAGHLAVIGQTSTDPGPVDMAVGPHGHFLYAQTGGNGIVDEYSMSGGSLTEIGSVTVANAAGGEGIAAA